MAQQFGVDILTPEEVAEKSRIERLQSQRAFQAQNVRQQFGFNLAQALGATFGRNREQENAVAQQKAASVGQRVKNAHISNGSSAVDAELASRAAAAAHIRAIGGADNIALANQITEGTTDLLIQQEQRTLQTNKLKAETKAAEARSAREQRAVFEELSLGELKELQKDPTLAAAYGVDPRQLAGQIADVELLQKRADEKFELERNKADIARKNQELAQKREDRIANALNTTEFGIVKKSDQQYNESKDMEDSAVFANEALNRAEAAGRSAGKALDIAEQVKKFAGTEDEDITVAQKLLSERAMKRAFSLKQAGAMSDAEFEAYMTAVLNASSSAPAWREFLRLDALTGAKGAIQAAFMSDYIAGLDMPQYIGIVDTDVPRGLEGAGNAWRLHRDDAYAVINEKYSRENWGTSSAAPTAVTPPPKPETPGQKRDARNEERLRALGISR